MSDARAPATVVIAGIEVRLRGDAAILGPARAWLQALATNGDGAMGDGTTGARMAPVATVALDIHDAEDSGEGTGSRPLEPEIRDMGPAGLAIESDCFSLRLAVGAAASASASASAPAAGAAGAYACARGTLAIRTDPRQPSRGVQQVLASALKSTSAALLARHGGVLLHCSAAALADGGAAVFCGKSGAGKSTILDMLDTVRPLADDLAGIVTDDDGGDNKEDVVGGALPRPPRAPRVHPTPFGRTGFAARLTSPDSAPLRAGFALAQRPTPSYARLAPAEAVRRLLPLLALPRGDRALEEKVFATAAHLAHVVPWYVLGFTKDTAATRAIVAAALRDCEALP